MKLYVLLGVLLTTKCITGLDPILDGDPRRTFPFRRAIDGTRGRKYYEPEVEDAFDIYGPGGQYNSYGDDISGFDDIRRNVPGEPGVDYPSYTRIPQTNFQCQGDYRGYYADENAGCQLFHVCDSTFLVSSFLCPIGSTFSQKLLTCDWWNKVDCSSTQNYYTVNSQTFPREIDDDEILRKAYEMTTLQTSPNRISVSSRDRNVIPGTVQYVNDLQTRSTLYNNYDSEKIEYKYSSRYNADEINQGLFSPKSNQRNPKIKVYTIGQDQKNDADEYEKDFRPSYAPTVPTVTTTTRTFYSPTVPTTANPRSNPRYDLDYDSSNHLYSARGKSTTLSPGTKSTVDTTTVVVEVPPTLSHSPATEQSTGINQDDIITEKSRIVSEFTMIEFQSLHNGENHTFQIDIDTDQNSERTANASSFNPTTVNISPPFFPYSNFRNNHADDSSHEEHNATASSNQLVINLPPTDIIPPLIKHLPNETGRDTVNEQTPSLNVELISPGETERRLPEVGIIASSSLEVDKGSSQTPEVELRPPGLERIEVGTSEADKINPKLLEAGKSDLVQPQDSSFIVKPALEIEIRPPLVDFKDPEINLTPPLFNEVRNFTINVPELRIEEEKNENYMQQPSKFFLPPYLYYSQGNPLNSLEQVPQDDSSRNETIEDPSDSVVGESSPYQVTLTVKGDEHFNPRGDLIKSLIAQQEDSEDIRDVEISKSLKGEAEEQFRAQANDDVVEGGQIGSGVSQLNPDGRASRSQPGNYAFLRGINSLGFDRRHPQHIPRPFSVRVQNQGISSHSSLISDPRLVSDLKLIPDPKPLQISHADLRLTSEPESNAELETSEEFSSELSSEDPKSQVILTPPGTSRDAPIRFELPQITRTTTFRKDKELKNLKIASENAGQKTEKPEATSTQAEVIPSIGFSLNTEEERKEYREAVLRGLFPDVSIPSVNSSTKPSVNTEKENGDES